MFMAFGAGGCADRTAGVATDSSRLLAERWLRATEGTQRATLADQLITLSEYTDSVEAARKCVELGGFGTSAPRQVGDGVRLDFVVRPEGKAAEEAFEVLTTCRSAHLEAVESVYLAQHSRIEEGREVLEEELLDCLENHGVSDVPTGLQDFQLFELLRDRDVSTGAWFCRDTFLIALGELGATPPG